jgi:hypothetical protein
MANFFSYFPKIKYTTSAVVDILSRIGIRDNYIDKEELFYNYIIQDNDTPENIAAKYYGDSGKHWVIMMFNNIFDPLSSFPMDNYTFEKYLNKKYYNEGLAINRSGVEYSQITQNPDPFAYRITITTSQPELSIYNNITSYETITSEPEIYYNTANTALSINTTPITFGTITKNVLVEQIMIYDWEYKLNEDKRSIKLLKKEYAINIEQELKKIS